MARVVLAAKRKGGVLRRVAIEKGDSGGHVVEHQYEDKDGFPTHTEHHVFGEGEDEALLQHLIKHLALKSGDEDEGDYYDNEEDSE
jgi:hypothetical protein